MPRSASLGLRVERLYEQDGLRYRVVEETRQRYPAKQVRRERLPLRQADPEALMVRLEGEHAQMAERVLREGARGWRRWSTLRRRAGAEFSPLVVELELLDHLCRESGLQVEDRWRNGSWMAERFRVDQSVWPWLGILDPATVRAELEQELTHPQLVEALVAGPGGGVSWASFAFVLRAGERALELADHGLAPGERELAGLVDHTKAWTPARRQLFEQLTGRPFYQLVTRRDRPIEIRGPVAHAEGGLWASSVSTVELALEGQPRGVLLVENRETFRHLLTLAERDWIVLHVPGGPPPAEVELVERLLLLDPQLRFYAAFDPDPAGIRIALTLSQRAGVELDPAGMQPRLLRSADHRLPLTDWDREWLSRLQGRSGPFEELRATMLTLQEKAEQETYQQALRQLFAEL
jgi:hypothetical protein